MGSCLSDLCDCCDDKQEKEKQRLRKQFPELYAPPEKAYVYASSPSNILTEDITLVFDSETDDIESDNKFIESKGYKLMEQCGQGMSGIVFKGLNTNDSTIIACKRVDIKLLLDKTEKDRYSIKNELLIIQKTKHPNIVRVYDHFMIKRPKTQSVYIIMDFVGNDLSKLIRLKETHFDEPTCQRMFAQISSEICYMHGKRIAHRDLKLANILLDNKLNALVTDFGLSIVAYRPSKGGIILSYSISGTPPYFAPEILKCVKDKSVPYDPFKADIWALGVILCCMINKAQPFDIKDIKTVNIEAKLKSMKNKPMPITTRHTPKNLSKHCIDMQKRLLEFDVRNRITSEQIVKHPWISDQIKLIKYE